MPVLRAKDSNGVWYEVAGVSGHKHTMSEVTDFPSNVPADVESLKEKVGESSVADQIAAAVEHKANAIHTHSDLELYNTVTGYGEVDIVVANPGTNMTVKLSSDTYSDFSNIRVDLVGEGRFSSATAEQDGTVNGLTAISKFTLSLSSGTSGFDASKVLISCTYLIDVGDALNNYVLNVDDALEEEYGDGSSSAYHVILVDDSLSITGAAADAKATGNAIKVVRDKVNGLSKVATSGDYNDLINKPEFTGGSNITVSDTYDATSSDAMSGKAVAEALQTVSVETTEQVQVDWTQTDSTQADFIKNKPSVPSSDVAFSGEYLDLKHRPFGEIDSIIKENVTFRVDEELDAYYYSISDISLVEGEQYKVTWDGTEYTRTCKRYGDSTLLYIGNLSIFGSAFENTEEPFLMAETSIMTTETSEKHTFSVIPVNAIKKIDSKYLPDMGSGLPEITAADNGKVLGVVNGSPKWVEQSGNVSSDIVDIFPEQEITIILQNEEIGKPHWLVSPATFVLTAGETYHVIWDGAEYSCVAFGDSSGAVIGNTKFLDGTDTGEPFAFSYEFIEEDGITNSLNICVTDDAEETTHIVRIYQDKKTIDLPSDFFVPEEKLTDVLPKEDLDFTYNSSFDAYTALAFYNEEVYQEWESYNGMVRVVWDNIEYDVPMQHIDALSGVGDCTGFGGTGNDEPFIIGIIKETNSSVEGGYDYIMIIMSKTTEASHNVQISYIGEIPKVNVNYLPPIEKEFLPDVTNEDNGKILTVSDGAWVVKQVQAEQVQSDWDEADTTSSAFIKNKPFYTENVVEEIFPEQTVEGFSAMELQGMSFFIAQASAPYTLVKDATYKIRWDETEYELTAFESQSSSGGTLIGVGNQVLAGGAVDEIPFGIIYDPEYQSSEYFSFISGTSHTVGIIFDSEVVHPLDAKYLPMDAIEEKINEALGVIENGTY